MIQLTLFICLLGLGYYWGKRAEFNHLKSLRHREVYLSKVSWSSVGKKEDFSASYLSGQLFIGQVVIAQDFFKAFIAGLIGIIGGRITVYESLLDRGRREALCRLRENALKSGYTSLINVRFETSTLGSNNNNKASGVVEVLAYGTGIKDSENHV